MGLFSFRRKNSVDVVDLTDMQKRGLLPTKMPKANEEGIVDYSRKIETSANANNSDGLDFLSNLAKANLDPSPGPITSSLREARQKTQIEAEINHLKLKLDDNEYRISEVNQKIKRLEAKLKEMEGR